MSFPLRIVTADQRSAEWRAARAGKLTSSRAADAMATIKSGEAAACRDYRMELVIERITGEPIESTFINREMQRGIDLEPYARAKYEAETGNMVRQVGFIERGDVMAGTSPDGVVGSMVGIVEIKCPKSATHVSYLKGNRLPPDYDCQVLHHFWVSGCQWVDFVSFDDRLPAGLDYFCVRVLRDEVRIADYEKRALAFLASVEAEELVVRGLRKAA